MENLNEINEFPEITELSNEAIEKMESVEPVEKPELANIEAPKSAVSFKGGSICICGSPMTCTSPT